MTASAFQIRDPRQRPGRMRWSNAAHLEAAKLASLRSSWWILAVTVSGAVAIGVAVGLNTRAGSGDLTNNALAGMIPGLLLAGLLGVLTATGDYSSGMIRASLAAVPRRGLLLTAKAGVLGAVLLAAGEAAAFISFLAGGLALRHGIAAPSLGQPGVLRAVLLTGTSYCLVGLLGLGLGLAIRHTAAAVAVLVGGVYVAAQLAAAVLPAAAGYMPVIIIGNSLSTTRPVRCAGSVTGCPHILPAWAGLGVLALYAALALLAGGWLLARRDA